MSREALAALAPAIVFALCAAGMLAPLLMQRVAGTGWPTLAGIALLAVGLFTASGAIGYGALAIGTLLHAYAARSHTRTGAATLLVAALATAAAAIALAVAAPVFAFGASVLAIALRAGVLPLHAGIAELTERAPAQQAQQLASAIALVFLHLLFVDHHQAAYDAAPWIVRIGAVATLLPALFALVQRDLRGLVRNAVVMHGGMLLAAVGAAGHGHYAAAMLVAITLGLAVGGFVLVAHALERRAGALTYADLAGRARAYPTLAAAFALFGAAGVGMPGTAGFIADDLFLHALWEESEFGTVTVILASACLAIGTLLGFARLFLGRQQPSFAPDLSARERLVVVVLVVLLVAIGIVPELILAPAEALLGS
jgi:NADH-quinone oxidoreductase subunit M